MEEPPPRGEKALETRRKRTVALFQARMGRWQPLQTAAFAIITVSLVAHLGGQLAEPMFLLATIVVALAIAVSAGVQSAYEAHFQADMEDIEQSFERLKRRRRNR